MDANWSDTTTTDEQSCFEQHQENSSQLNVEQEGIQEEGEEDINNSEDYYESETADDNGYHATNNSSKQVATSQVGPGIDTYPKLQQRQILSEDDEPKHASHIISLKNNVSRGVTPCGKLPLLHLICLAQIYQHQLVPLRLPSVQIISITYTKNQSSSPSKTARKIHQTVTTLVDYGHTLGYCIHLSCFLLCP